MERGWSDTVGTRPSMEFALEIGTCNTIVSVATAALLAAACTSAAERGEGTSVNGEDVGAVEESVEDPEGDRAAGEGEDNASGRVEAAGVTANVGEVVAAARQLIDEFSVTGERGVIVSEAADLEDGPSFSAEIDGFDMVELDGQLCPVPTPAGMDIVVMTVSETSVDCVFRSGEELGGEVAVGVVFDGGGEQAPLPNVPHAEMVGDMYEDSFRGEDGDVVWWGWGETDVAVVAGDQAVFAQVLNWPEGETDPVPFDGFDLYPYMSDLLGVPL